MRNSFVAVVVLAMSCSGELATSEYSSNATHETCFTVQRGTNGDVADSYIKANAMHENFGARPILKVSKHDEALLRFDLGQLPANATIERATLRLYINGGAGDGTISVHRAMADWAESTVTYGSFAQKFARSEEHTSELQSR